MKAVVGAAAIIGFVVGFITTSGNEAAMFGGGVGGGACFAGIALLTGRIARRRGSIAPQRWALAITLTVLVFYWVGYQQP